MNKELDLIMGKIDIFGTKVELTRQEAAIATMLKYAPRNREELGLTIFDEMKSTYGKVLGVHFFNLRKKLDGIATITYCGKESIYTMTESKNLNNGELE